MIIAERYHDISCGHRVVNHESKCRFLHGHNYRIYFRIAPNSEDNSLDSIGRVVDFSIIKSTLCNWLEEHWDHQFLIWEEDPLREALTQVSPESIVLVPFNPTAENMAEYLMQQVAPRLLTSYHCKLIECRVEETRKCSATATL